MKEVIRQHGGAIIETAGALLVITLLAGCFFGDVFAKATGTFSVWLYG